MEAARKFFYSRRYPNYGYIEPSSVRQIGYANVPRIIGMLVSRKLATLIELQTVYGAKDAYDLLEVMTVDSYNDYLARKK